MKLTRTVRAFTTVGLLFSISSSVAQESRPSIPIADVMRQIEYELVEAQKSEYADLQPKLKIEKVTLEFSSSVVEAVEGGMSLEIPVLEVDAGVAREESTLVKYVIELRTTKHIDVRTQEAQPIGFANEIQKIKTALRASLRETEFLDPMKVSYETEFGVQVDADAGVKFVILSVGAGEQRSNTHKISIEMVVH